MTAKINKFDKFFLACNDYPQCNGIKKIDEIKEFVL
jgi:ssDNA-binding Zn-finger/Zn-ribbon topoisomerase 1